MTIEFVELTEEAAPGQEVCLACPHCDWQSSPVWVKDEPNGTWKAFDRLLVDYHWHFSGSHRPPPLRLVNVNV